MNRLPKCLDLHGGVTNCYIAGGAVLSAVTKSDIADYDYYPKNLEGLLSVLEYTMSDGFILNISDRAITLKFNGDIDRNGERRIIQVMTYDFFDTPEKIFNNFDYTVCMGAYDCDTGDYHFHDDFYPDVASKTLRFNPGTLYPLNSLIRLAKYKAKGYYIGKMESAKLALAIADKGLPTSWDELEQQIGGSYGRQLSLEAEGEFSIDKAYELLSNVTLLERYESANLELSRVKYDKIASFFDYDSAFKLDEQQYVVSLNKIYDVSDIGQLKDTDSVTVHVPLVEGFYATNKNYSWRPFESSGKLIKDVDIIEAYTNKKTNVDYETMDIDIEQIECVNTSRNAISFRNKKVGT